MEHSRPPSVAGASPLTSPPGDEEKPLSDVERRRMIALLHELVMALMRNDRALLCRMIVSSENPLSDIKIVDRLIAQTPCRGSRRPTWTALLPSPVNSVAHHQRNRGPPAVASPASSCGETRLNIRGHASGQVSCVGLLPPEDFDQQGGSRFAVAVVVYSRCC